MDNLMMANFPSRNMLFIQDFYVKISYKFHINFYISFQKVDFLKLILESRKIRYPTNMGR